MHAVSLGDLLLAAQVLAPLPPQDRSAACKALCTKAVQAQVFRLRAGQVHPFYGDGSLGSAARHSGAERQSPYRMTPEFLTSLQIVLAQILGAGRTGPAF